MSIDERSNSAVLEKPPSFIVRIASPLSRFTSCSTPINWKLQGDMECMKQLVIKVAAKPVCGTYR